MDREAFQATIHVAKSQHKVRDIFIEVSIKTRSNVCMGDISQLQFHFDIMDIDEPPRIRISILEKFLIQMICNAEAAE